LTLSFLSNRRTEVESTKTRSTLYCTCSGQYGKDISFPRNFWWFMANARILIPDINSRQNGGYKFQADVPTVTLIPGRSTYLATLSAIM